MKTLQIILTGVLLLALSIPAKSQFRRNRMTVSDSTCLNTASGQCATAFGYGSEASGRFSFAVGAQSKATGFGSIAIGAATQSTGYGSLALGNNVISNGNGSVVIGQYASAGGFNGTLVFADGLNNQVMSATSNNQVLLRGSGGFSFITGTSLTTGGLFISMAGRIGIGGNNPQNSLDIYNGGISVNGQEVISSDKKWKGDTTGLAGRRGPQGPQGPKGDKGDKGDTGPEGSCSCSVAAAASAAAAAASATAAGVAATTAGESAIAAEASAATATAEATSATTSATNAGVSARAAAQSQTAAEESASTAELKADSAQVYSSRARTYMQNAEVYRDSAKVSADKAQRAANAPLGGDLTGKLSNANVVKIQNRPVSGTNPQNGQFLVWNGTAWTPTKMDTVAYHAGRGIAIRTDTVKALTDSAFWNAKALYGRPLRKQAPVKGNHLGWSGTAWAPVAPAWTTDSLNHKPIAYTLLSSVGINTKTPQGLLHINGAKTASSDSSVVVGRNGNLSIKCNKTDTTFALVVNGEMLAKGFTVESDWADYVFEEDYRLMPLEEVKSFIATEKHLPHIPSSNEVKTNGLDVGKMQVLMMEKIEELTLYLIQLKEENKRLADEIQKLKSGSR